MSEPIEADFIKKAGSTAEEFAKRTNIKGENLPSPEPKNTESKNISTLCHLSMIFLGPIVPIFVYLLKQDDQFIMENTKEDINFAITLTIVGFVLTVSIVGILLLWTIYIANFGFSIYLAMQSSEGKVGRIPYIIRFLK
jgi:uncharacterized protein